MKRLLKDLDDKCQRFVNSFIFFYISYTGTSRVSGFVTYLFLAVGFFL